MKKSAMVAAALACTAALPSAAHAEDQVRIVGSSTVYPFSTVVAERFGRTSGFKTPIVESTGTGGGFKLFCAGVGSDTVDVINASRAIKSSEVEMCAGNGVQNIIEVKIGYDGIVLANSNAARDFSVSTKDIFLALAKEIPAADGSLVENTNVTWSDVNASLPNTKIEVLGPPPTSGTRDAFLELAMEAGCKQFDSIKALKSSDKNAYKAVCHTMREDGAFIDAGENDNLIVQKLDANENALGIFGFSFLDQNSDKVKAAKINDVDVSFEAIADGSYPISRPLYFYVKGEHLTSVKSLKPFVEEFISNAASGEEGYLSDRGLIPMGEEERAEFLSKITSQLNK
ncbi:PstS family phosphate ABC transporter substrate-binding protein [Kordiimonas sediminis]|uniref:PstS family phosphate ABC transporter substrate-binding protein n=1 Tax=Kordiimonas sediminis TaxID=1735581 RepID=UPI0035715FF2